MARRGSGLTRRAPDTIDGPGDVAEWLRSGLQSRVHRFDSGRRLRKMPAAGRPDLRRLIAGDAPTKVSLRTAGASIGPGLLQSPLGADPSDRGDLRGRD